MSINLFVEMKVESPLTILNAPKIRFKKPMIYPTPFSLSDSDDEKEIEINANKDYSSDEEESNDFNDF